MGQKQGKNVKMEIKEQYAQMKGKDTLVKKGFGDLWKLTTLKLYIR